VTEAHAVNFELRNGAFLSGTDLGTVPTGAQFDYFSPITSPTGSGAYVLQATAGALEAQAQCSFHVACSTACECPTGQHCVDGNCMSLPDPLYCCTAGPCPMGALCQFPAGNITMCAMP
jgi:hypothetical protein